MMWTKKKDMNRFISGARSLFTDDEEEEVAFADSRGNSPVNTYHLGSAGAPSASHGRRRIPNSTLGVPHSGDDDDNGGITSDEGMSDDFLGHKPKRRGHRAYSSRNEDSVEEENEPWVGERLQASSSQEDFGRGRDKAAMDRRRGYQGRGCKHTPLSPAQQSSDQGELTGSRQRGARGSELESESAVDIYSELQMINEKMKREFKILHERDRVVKERERVLTEAESAVAAAKASLELTIELEVKRRVESKEQEHRAEVERVDQMLKEKAKENKRLKENFDTLKVANETLRKELTNLEGSREKLEKQTAALQARLTNFQRKAEHDQRKDSVDYLPQELIKARKQSKDAALKNKNQIAKTCSGSYDVLAILLEWVSDVHLRQMITDQPTKPLDTICSLEAVQERCLKVLPNLVEIVKDVASSQPRLVLPCLQFIYWSLLHLDTAHAPGGGSSSTGGAAKMNLSSTLRRLGEELYKSRLVRFAEDETGTIPAPQVTTARTGEKARDKEGVFFRSPHLHIRLLSSLIILRSLNQVDHLAHVFEVLKTDLKTDQAKQLFLHYQATTVIIPFLRPTNKTLLQAAVDVYLGMAMESPVLSGFLEACSTEVWFRAIAMVMRMPNIDDKITEKLSILLQKLSKIKTNKRYFEVFGLTLSTQELHRAASASNNAFLTLNLKSILFNLNAKCS